jgi:predicted esterase
VIAALALAAVVQPPPGAARVALGAVTPSVVCASDARFSYAVYVPAGYDPARSWPILFVFDPRGRGPHAAGVFQEAAAAHGLIVASSNDTASDDPAAPNAAAVTAVWTDAHARFAIDPARRYAAGFSGTGRLAVRLGLSRPGALAGAIAAGSRLLMDVGRQRWPFAFFGAAGDADFNHPAMWALDEQLAANGTPHRTANFDGGHEWMPPSLALEAFDWMAVKAVGAGPDVVRRLRDSAAGRARALEAAGRAGEALLVWEGLAADLGAADVAGEMARLGAAARRERDRFRGVVARDREWIDAANVSINTLAQDPPPPLPRLLRDLKADGLAKDAAGGDRVAALSAARRRNAAATNAALYLAPRFRAEGRLVNARRACELAVALAPDHAGIARACDSQR